jgi:hypothetical protein
MRSYGAAFLVTSAAVCSALSRRVNIVLLLGSRVWLRITIGAFALAAGAITVRVHTQSLRRLRRRPAGPVPANQVRLKAGVTKRLLLLAMIGIVALAVAVNRVELLCSAGIPAVHTQALALNDLSAHAYYGDLLFCITVFLLDDATSLEASCCWL